MSSYITLLKLVQIAFIRLMNFSMQLILKVSVTMEKKLIPIGELDRKSTFPEVSSSQGSSESRKQAVLRINLEGAEKIFPPSLLKEEKKEKGGQQMAKEVSLLKMIVQKMNNLEVKIDDVTSNVKEMKEDIRELKKDVQEMKKDISLLKEDVGLLQVDVSTIKQDVEGLKNRMNEMEQSSINSATALSSALNMIAFGEEKAAEARTNAFGQILSLRAFSDLMKKEAQAKRYLSTALQEMAKTLQ